jgi:hypothetical protein
MRGVRAGVAAAVAVCAGMVPTAAASAHPMAIPVRVEVGAPVVVEIEVPVEVDPDGPATQAMVGVDVRMPEGFTLTVIEDTPGWTTAREGAVVAFLGRGLPNRNVRFRFLGSFAENGAYLFVVTTRNDDGSSVVWDEERTQASLDASHATDLHPAPIVFAGVTPFSVTAADRTGGASDDGASSLVPVLLGAVIVGAAVTAAVVVRRRRA